MILRYLFLLLTTATLCGNAQTITGAEYFVDADPGVGNATTLTVSAAESVSVDFARALNGLSPGFHKLNVRYFDSEGRWGKTNGRYLFVPSTPVALENDIQAAEYFVDSDPGVGNATPLTVISNDSVVTAFVLNNPALSVGFHKVYVRYRDQTNRWGRANGSFFYVAPLPNYAAFDLVQAEYFWNSDPGIGSANPLAILPDDSTGGSIAVTLEGFSPGVQKLYARYRDQNGRWGKAIGQLQYLLLPDTLREQYYVAGAEYFIDSDPGIGNATAILPDDGIWNELEESATLSINPQPLGGHRVGFRFRDNLNRWTITALDSFVVGPVLTIRVSGPNIVLNWSGGSSDMYYLYSSTSMSGAFQLVDSTAAQTYTHTNAATLPELKRYYRLTHRVGE